MFLAWDLLVFVAALGLAAFSPGPGLAAIVAIVLAQGTRVAIWFCVGVIAGDLAWLALSLSGLAFIARQIPVLFLVIKWVGVIYLLYLAVKIWRSPPDTISTERPQSEKAMAAVALSGFLVTMGNPKMMLFYIALLPSIISPELLSLPMILSLVAAVIVVLATVFTIYVSAAEKARQLLRSKQSLKLLNHATAITLGGAALWIAAK